MPQLAALLFFVLSLVAVPQGAMASEAAHLRLYTTTGDFDTVRDDVELAITGRGFVIDHRSHIGEMLDRTGKDLGTTKPIYSKAESMQFCSATVSRRLMEADPTNIVFCPYIIVLYTLPQMPKTVHVGYRRPPSVKSAASRAALKEVDDLLDGIIKEALNIK
jgi:uncharacterized protein (DUF302 family)